MRKRVSNEIRLRIIKLRADNPELTARQIAVRVGFNESTVSRVLQRQPGSEAGGSEGGMMGRPASQAKRCIVLWLRTASPELTASQIGLRVGLSTRTVQRILEQADQKPQKRE